MKRRDFLRLSGAGCAALAASGSASARALIAGSPARVTYRPTWAALEIDATRLARGDAETLRHGARLMVFGLAPDHTGSRGRAALDVHFPQGGWPRDGWQARFCSWAQADAGVCGEPGVASFVLPLDAAGRATLEPSWEGVGFPVSLTTGSEIDLPKLRVGIYLFSASSAAPIVATVSPADGPGHVTPPWRSHHAS